eukprot:CAMPEP_0117009372 /NCGR_PEP_ID=MMETSP0472-20121206/8534_1 /TAXON_ID=693140 ORGANISM="Tiarina fusus, Strain LIS" /NCGR_SAMPLE_ID=MMETSP0472 /ASSEMBLY_ACC=CAM_ASM_000603 /LENGTH=521 /DNA_ID=CAMNT_0004711639 /DNA_START=1 /DNA_END=1566 /DNA_ORIENTATION=+
MSGRKRKASQTMPTPGRAKKGTTLDRFKNWKDPKKGRLSCGFYRASEILPPIVEQTCKYLERNALQQEGLFRVPGSQEDVRYIKDKFDKRRKVDLNKEENANTVAGVLKLFFTELANPVLSYELYPSFMAAVGMKEQLLRVWCTRRTIATLPPGNRVVLDRVCAMFRIISRFADDNKMTAKNIALVMNPSMFRDKEGNLLEFMTTGGLRTRLVELLITNHEDLFVAPKEELHERVRALEPSMTLETQQKLDSFSEILREGSILLAKNLLNEGETEIQVQFDDTDAFATPVVIPSSEEVKGMSFEEFAAHMAINPPGGIEIVPPPVANGQISSRNNRRSAFRYGTVNAPTKYNPGNEKRLSKCFSMGDLEFEEDDDEDDEDLANITSECNSVQICIKEDVQEDIIEAVDTENKEKEGEAGDARGDLQSSCDEEESNISSAKISPEPKEIFEGPDKKNGSEKKNGSKSKRTKKSKVGKLGSDSTVPRPRAYRSMSSINSRVQKGSDQKDTSKKNSRSECEDKD